MSKLFGRSAHLLRLADEKGLDEKGFDILVNDGFQADLFEAAQEGTLQDVNREEFRKMIGLGPLGLKIKVDYNLYLEQMITAGNYYWKNESIAAENFPVVGQGVKELAVELVHFDRGISSDNAEKELNKMGLRPAKIEELLAFGVAYPEIQRKFPVIALASVASIDGNHRVAYLSRRGSERGLGLSLRGGVWGGVCRFLAVRKESSES